MLCIWGKQCFDSLLKAIIDELFVFLVKQFQKKKTEMRHQKAAKRRIKKILALILCIGVMCLCMVADQKITGLNSDLAAVVTTDTTNCGADNEEVNCGLPVQ